MIMLPWERETLMCCLPSMPHRGLNPSLCMCPNEEPKPQYFSVWDHAPTDWDTPSRLLNNTYFHMNTFWLELPSAKTESSRKKEGVTSNNGDHTISCLCVWQCVHTWPHVSWRELEMTGSDSCPAYTLSPAPGLRQQFLFSQSISLATSSTPWGQELLRKGHDCCWCWRQFCCRPRV